MVRETVFPYSGAEAGGAFAQRTFTYLRSHQVPAGKTTSREPLRNSSLAAKKRRMSAETLDVRPSGHARRDGQRPFQ